jgi:simple sugar transport system ATP-binding protein
MTETSEAALAHESAPPQSVVVMKGIRKSFGPVLANDDVDFELQQGEIHALLGANGAGKTTLMNILFGMFPPDAGTISIAGEQVAHMNPRRAREQGIGMVHQHFMLIGDFTVAENAALGRHTSNLARISRTKVTRQVEQTAQRFDIQVPLSRRVRDLSVVVQQRVELLKLLHAGAKIIILDEPTAVLGPNEVETLFDTLRSLARLGTSIVIITHKLREVVSIADRVTVLRDGQVVRRDSRNSLNVDQMAFDMIGRDIPAPIQRTTWQDERQIALQVQELTAGGGRGADDRPAISDITFTVAAGEVVGIAGVEGNGQTELCEALSGLIEVSRGSFDVYGRDVTHDGPAGLHAAGLRSISADRSLWDMVADLSVSDNLALSKVRTGKLSKGGLLRRKEMLRQAEQILEEHDIRPRNPKLPIGRLSGGNQQKVVIARECTDDTRVLIASQPTRGLDLAATAFVHNHILELRNRGCAVVVNSMDLEELLLLADRIFVLYRGEICLIEETATIDLVRVANAMTGGVQ